MEELKLRYDQLLRAYKRLKYMTEKYVQLSQMAKNHNMLEQEENELIAHRDALIKRFEFCYELTWKFLKLLLKTQFLIDSNSPRSIFRDCYQQNILNREETGLLLETIDARNATSHIYDELAAESISKKIVDYYPVLSHIINKIKPS